MTVTSTTSKCSYGFVVCGIQLRVEAINADDTAVNAIKLFCCPFM